MRLKGGKDALSSGAAFSLDDVNVKPPGGSWSIPTSPRVDSGFPCSGSVVEDILVILTA